MSQLELAKIIKNYKVPTSLGGVQAYGRAPAVSADFNGSKFAGGFGETKLFSMDYWSLRERSAQLFTENLYARGLINRLVTNEINTGLTPECAPDEEIIGLEPDSLDEWTEDVENRFLVWASDESMCDYKGRHNFGELQSLARFEALISGDVLVVIRSKPRSITPSVQLIRSACVQTPLGGARLAKGHEIKHGVELDKEGRAVAYWVQQKNGTESKRLAAYGTSSKRRVAWLLFGSNKRLDAVRGEPLLSIVLQSLKEIDRYRDSTQRKAVINSILAMFIKKNEEKMGTRPISAGAVRRSSVEVNSGGGDEAPREWNMNDYVPGMVIEELQVGEEPVLKGGEGTDTNFRDFEQAIISAVAWANEVPPEILTLAFSSNYAASQAAVNEFRMYLNKIWGGFGANFCQPIYADWLISEVAWSRIDSDGLIEAMTDPAMRYQFISWQTVNWYGSIKPSTDMVKQAKGSQVLVSEGWSNNARESRTLTGTKFSKNVKRLKKENEMKAEAMRPLAEFKQEFGMTTEEARDGED